jgi:hypothetical protein
MATGVQRVTIGFAGGPSVSVRVKEDALKDLRNALSGGGWHVLETEDGEVTLNLGQIVFLDVDTGEPRVGFS